MNDSHKGLVVLIITLSVGMATGWLIASAAIPLTKIQFDRETGCEYMVNRNGGITPRIAADYMHMGCKGVQDNE